MITHLKGIVHSLGIDHVVLDVHGVGYHIVCSARTLEALTVSEAAFLITELVIREDAHLLYGFQSLEERDMYRLLVSVQGVGSKVAIALLSRGSPGELIQALQQENKDFLCQAEGVGPKLGARLITELKDHVKKLALIRPDNRGIDRNTFNSFPSHEYASDAKLALTSLGYKPYDIDKAFDSIWQQALEVQSVEHLIRLSLYQLARQS